MLHLGAFLSPTAFCMQNLLKISQYVNEFALFEQTVSTPFIVDSCFGLILLFIILTSLFWCALDSGQRYFLALCLHQWLALVLRPVSTSIVS